MSVSTKKSKGSKGSGSSSKGSSSVKEIRQPVPSFNRCHTCKKSDIRKLHRLSAPHVDGFNYFLDVGLSKGITDIGTYEVDMIDTSLPENRGVGHTVGKSGDTLQFWLENVKIGMPTKTQPSGLSSSGSKSMKLYPRESRELGIMYSAQISGDFCFQFLRRDGYGHETATGSTTRISRNFGMMPIMTMSKACHLYEKSPNDLIKLKEEETEFGGYFIVNGIERCVRLLQVPRANHATSIQRSNYKNRGKLYTDLGLAIRCQRHNGDMSTITNTLHYLTTGGATLKFVARKQEFLLPVVLVIRALSGCEDRNKGSDGKKGGHGITDEELYQRIVQGDETNTFVRARAELLLQEARQFTGMQTPDECLAFIGSRFRLLSNKANSTSDVAIGNYIMNKYVLIHLPSYGDKLEYILFMLRKLYSFAAGDCGVDNADSLQNQEILLPGHLLCTFVKEKFEETLSQIRVGLMKEMRLDYTKFLSSVPNNKWWTKIVDRYGNLSAGGIGKKVQHFLSTGNIISTTGLDLMQVSGYTIVAEKLNFLRFCAHFRSVHRGQFFLEMKTTAVRKLLPDQWGFLCPVHTPDGGPCGLLSHMALKCQNMAYPAPTTGGELKDLNELLISWGVAPTGTGGERGDGCGISSFTNLPVMVDGRVIGGASAKLCKSIASQLRSLKVLEKPVVPPTMEVAFIPPGMKGGPYPGLFLFTIAARVVRPVLQRATGRTEYIGPMEQPFMDIACLPEDIREGITTHQELDPANMLSLIASLTPFSDYNQSPRNMYQCQMGKQTMGTPCHSLPYRPDNKLYKIQTPQAPLVQTAVHGEYKMDEYPNGTNAVVAVLSYTGFDMEDAMILNKSSYERGFGHASVYKTVKVDLGEEITNAVSRGADKDKIKLGNKTKRVRVPAENEDDLPSFRDDPVHPNLEEDGLPAVGTWVDEGHALYCLADDGIGKGYPGKHKEKERACVQTIRRLNMSGSSASGGKRGSAKESNEALSVTLRFPRNPLIGDKFSSRHGQKGVLSILWPQADMPFSESGISPDIIINPHAFPSRMTIGMLIESMAGKSGAMHGVFQDATPFTFHESGDKIAVDYFGEQLQAAGYNYYGSEPLYSGVSGCLMQADLYIGVVYYQRLRHMVSDKFQVRATGTVNPLTRQPIKGRKKGGGIRLGEMERDSLLSHGAAFLLHDRLLNCSDRHVAYVCRRCGDLLSPATERSAILSAGQKSSDATKHQLRVYCRNAKCCNAVRDEANDDAVQPIILPYVYRYLANELAAMNIKMKMSIN
mmetsp:Transcript_31069/g.56364  ORF Transcript_31069/g.56364 Transcript_31069/m.56364 type:complete len:1271 (+) Transcript_31069:150-3962(+)|eukprot:CAMPEP_0201917376 /NCGR_PEP_ID=MMETSP0903-20130614/6780_1 /ASSEMBLY_ACC=CAM_ASM_000552 /TAXON_ID=420261 /ORGANISM="Thalassiosira antarctica, Strain CCMP982" /LENGTH=1270 /DNA_ID=CAMNT_0048453425 /DNA_START=66 /DNA_END=3878 /DNA_ORIENTATION=+